MADIVMGIQRTDTMQKCAEFNGEADVVRFHDALFANTDDVNYEDIIDILVNRRAAQRSLLAKLYKRKYHTSLYADVCAKLRGRFKDVVLGLLTPLEEYDASQMYFSIKGLGTDEATLVEILCTRTNAHIKEINKAYATLYGKDLESDIRGDTSGAFKDLLVSLNNGSRAEDSSLDEELSERDAQELYHAGEMRRGADRSVFQDILSARSYEHLCGVFDAYGRVSDNIIEKAVSQELSGDLEMACLNIVRCARNMPAFFSEKIYKCSKGISVDHRSIIRIFVTRCEVDLVKIRQEFDRRHTKTLELLVESIATGEYRDILLHLMGTPPRKEECDSLSRSSKPP